jgi:8-oxo-dGTP diphosphatase
MTPGTEALKPTNFEVDGDRKMTERTVVRALARSRCGGYVLLRRAAGDRLAGRWELPGGSVEAGEPLDAALARELREEAGLEVAATPRHIASARRRTPRGTPMREVAFRVEAKGRPRLSSEHDAVHLWRPGTKVPGALTESAAELLAYAEAA